MSTLVAPGFGIAMGMVHTLVRFFQPKVTIQYPESSRRSRPHHRGRLLLLYDEAGNLKCETCFQCAMACPIEIIDMGGVDTKNRYHVHWGPPEQYGERREESALRRSGRPVPDRTFYAWLPIDLGPLERILVANDYDPRRLLTILEATQAEYGHLPVAAIQHISHSTGAWYSEIYGIATSLSATLLRARARVRDRDMPLSDVHGPRRRPHPRRTGRRAGYGRRRSDASMARCASRPSSAAATTVAQPSSRSTASASPA